MVIVGIFSFIRTMENHEFESLKGLRVLVVEDNPAALDAIRSGLEFQACRVDVAGSAESAFSLLEGARPDQAFELVFIDCSLPDQDNGLETARRMKLSARMANLPVILMGSSAEVLPLTENLIVDGLLIKPFTRRQLIDTLIIGRELEMQVSDGSQPVWAKTQPVTSTLSSIRFESGLTAENLEKLRGARILLVEDNQINQMVASEILQNMGLQVTLAYDGEAALAAKAAEVVSQIEAGQAGDTVALKEVAP